jgi:two-component system chemotaxis sensor kinase CheA
MFISLKRHRRELQEQIGAGNRLSDAILKLGRQGFFLLDGKHAILPPVSASLAALFRRSDFANLTIEQLIGPLVTAKTLSAARAFLARLQAAGPPAGGAEVNPLEDVEVRLGKPDGTFETAHYSFEFTALDPARVARTWLVCVTDISARVQQARELEYLRTQVQTQAEILRSVLQAGAARFSAFLHRTDAAMHAIEEVLKKPAREADAFRNKLERMLDEVDRVRRDAAALKLGGLEAAARVLEDSLLELRARATLSGSDFLPLAVKHDQLYGQFALLLSLTSQASSATAPEEAAADAAAPPAEAPHAAAPDAPPRRAAAAPGGVTENGTLIIERPKFLLERAQDSVLPKAQRTAHAGSLESALSALTELVAQQHNKTVVLACTGMHLVPPRYQATIKNIAVQLIRNAVMHGVESSAERRDAGKAAHGTLQLAFRVMPDQSFEMHFQDDGCGLDADKVRATAVAKGLIEQDAAARMRDGQAIKLIFKSGYTTLQSAPGEATHGLGMALVRRYVHEARGRIALATLLGHETRFKLMLPAVAEAGDAADAQVA